MRPRARRPRETGRRRRPKAGIAPWEIAQFPSVQFGAFKGARKTMIESRFSVTLAAAVVLAAFAAAPGVRRGRGQGFGRRRRHQGRGMHRLPRRERKQHESGVAESRGTERRLHPRTARDVQGQEAQQPAHAADHRTAHRAGLRRSRGILLRADARRASKPIRRTGRRAKRCTSPATPRATSRPAPPVTVPQGRATRARAIRHCARSTRSTPSSSCRTT